MNLLDVYFHNKKVGVLKEHNSRLSFKYLDDATESIAYQLPLQKEAFGDKETRSFFSNLLPEGDVVKKISQIAPQNNPSKGGWRNINRARLMMSVRNRGNICAH